MKKMALFAGTSEGREIAEYIEGLGAGLELVVFTATEYGARLIEESIADHFTGRLSIRSGRLDADQMYAVFMEEGFELVIDATHPHAVLVTENISRAVNRCRIAGRRIGYLRVEREGRDDENVPEDILYFDSVKEAALYLAGRRGRVLSTIGTKELDKLRVIEEYSRRVFVRILPDADNVKKAKSLGFAPEKLICMQGPFSVRMNSLLMEELEIDYLLTKDSGVRGGFKEKLEAARERGVKCLVIRRPGEKAGGEICLDPSGAKEWIKSYVNNNSNNSDDFSQKQIDISNNYVNNSSKKAHNSNNKLIDITNNYVNKKVQIENPLNRAGLRRGITTGTCAALAAGAAAYMAVTGRSMGQWPVITPSMIRVAAPIEEACINKDSASCAVRKFSGDDPDVTDGLLVFASVRLMRDSKKEPKDLTLIGGEGIGTVTRKGLKVEAGEKAINPVPRQMILSSVKEVFEELGYEGSACITISVPGGEAVAAKTFNPVLGIEGGISIIGTTGIVEPISHEAFMDAIALQMDMHIAEGQNELILTPGSIGERLLDEVAGKMKTGSAGDRKSGVCVIQCGNFFGEALDLAVDRGFKSIVIAGHMGKLVKLAAGVMNTHSHMADARMEVIAAHAGMTGADAEHIRRIMDCISTDEAYEILEELGIEEKVIASVITKSLRHIRLRLSRRGGGDINIGITIFCGRDHRTFLSTDCPLY